MSAPEGSPEAVVSEVDKMNENIEEYARRYGLKSQITLDLIANTWVVVKEWFSKGSPLAKEVVKDLAEALQHSREAFELLYGPYMVALYSICTNTDRKSEPSCPSIVKVKEVLELKAKSGGYSQRETITAMRDMSTLEKMYKKYKEIIMQTQREEKKEEAPPKEEKVGVKPEEGKRRRLWPFGRR